MRSMKKGGEVDKRTREQAVEDIRSAAATAAEQARKEFYVQKVRFWRIAPGGERMLVYLREAAALDGVQLEEATEAATRR